MMTSLSHYYQENHHDSFQTKLFNKPYSASISKDSQHPAGLCLDGIFPGRVQTFLSLLFFGLQVFFMLVQPAPHGTSLLRPQIERLILFALFAGIHNS